MGIKRNKHRIALFTHLKGDISDLIKSAIGLAQMINGEIDVFSVTEPSTIIGKDNQLSAIRSINREYVMTDKRMKDIITPIIENYDVPINYSSTFGNLKNEIVRYLDENSPDILVLGRRKSNHFNTSDDRIINFILNVYEGTVFIASHNNGLEPGKKIGIGSLNCFETLFAPSFTENLLFNANSTLKSFSIVENSDALPQAASFLGHQTINYVFDYNENTVEKLPIYLSKSNIDLLFMERRDKEKEGLSGSLNLYDLVRKANINLLIIGKTHTHRNYNTKLKIA